MSMATEKRTLDPEQVHQLWLTIISLLKQAPSSSSDDAATTSSSTATATSTPNSTQQTSVSISALSSQLKSLEKTENAGSSSSKKSSDAAADLTIQQAIKEGLLVVAASPLTNGEGLTNGVGGDAATEQSFVSLPLADGSQQPVPSRTPTNGFAPHDWYCFGCHVVTGKQLIECNYCWRVYHSACVQPDHDFAVKLERDSQAAAGAADSPSLVIRARNFTCPVCTLTAKFAKFTIGSRLLSQSEFNQILYYTFLAFRSRASQISRNLLKLKEFAKLSSSSSMSSNADEQASSSSSSSSNSATCELNTQLALQYLSYKPVDLADIEEKLNRAEYQSMGEFLGDCLSFKHMIEVAVVAGTEAEHSRRRISDTLSRMLDSCRYDLKEMLGCIDCYRNSNRNQDDKFWFCRPCDPPHMLVFARQRGYPYWPAKVIYPRRAEEIGANTEYDVRFFGGQHERCYITTASDIKDINSSLAELAIQKANPSLEKALAELRVHRELLEKYEQGLDTDINPEDHVDGHKVVANKRANNRRPSATGAAAAVKRKPDSSSSSTAEKTDEQSTKISKNKSSKAPRSRSNTVESEAATISEKAESPEDGDKEQASEPQLAAVSEENSQDVFEDALKDTTNAVEEESAKDKAAASSDTEEETPPEEKEEEEAAPVAKKPRKATTKKKRKRAVKEEEEAVDSNNTQSEGKNSKEDDDELDTDGKRRRGRPRKYYPSPDERSNSSSGTSKKGRLPEKKANEKAQRRKQNIERQRQLIAERRKKSQKGSITPKHIPPVTATKSSPAFSGAPIFNTSIISPMGGRSQQTPNLQKIPFSPQLNKKPFLGQQVASPSGFNSPLFSFASQNGYMNSTFPLKHEITNFQAQMYNNLPHQSVQMPPPPPPLKFEPQTSSFSKSIEVVTNGGSTTEVTKTKLLNGTVNGCRENMDEESTSKTANNFPDDDDDDEEPYLYDDDQLEDQINEYVTYQEEKEQFEKVQKEQLHWAHQQQFIQQQQQMFRQMQWQQHQQQLQAQGALQNGTANGLIGSKMPPPPQPPPSPGKSKFPLGPAPKTYVEFSSSSIYVPTKANQNLVNHYLHQYSTNSASIPPSRSDYLAKLMLRKDEFEQMDQAQAELEQNQPTRKRGRPPKTATEDDVFERSGKAKSVVEKSYLQESSCDRACLMKNVKSFKRFRDFVESQKKEDIIKMKKDLEQLKQEVYRLKNAKAELEDDLKRERENNKRLDPQLLSDLEERHKAEVSKIKRKQWCIVCESEASFFCCPSTSYCSPECQHKHWFSGHSSKCNRSRVNNSSNSSNPSPFHKNNAIKH
ncbi:PREDICTED: uncharacterized protein LOC108379861 [Rhagoletis zephyria]|uniref:uncharacterized protein LOC108379861 n=1 Tax=Rhagoletis zephyria TaxID=28612 RepID=UPI0008113C04|nr:PREDICTED: uncharacterized protein LOC108379861 [Rhagoletis zephyria]